MRPRGRSDREVFETLQAAEAVATRLRALTDSLGPDFISMQFYVRIRVKSYDSIIKKIYGKRREAGRELYALEDVTDIVGLRIVTLYDDDVKKALNHVLALVEANGAGLDQTKGRLDQPLFKPIRTVKKPTEWDFIREVIFFHRGRGGSKDIYKECHETLLKQLRKRFRRNRTSYRLHRKKITLRDPEKESDRENVDSFASQGYSSIHLVLNAVANVGLRSIDVPIEVQMRTAAEDIWGEINHQLFYKARDSYVWTPTLQTTYDDMLDDSNSIKKSLDDLSDPITRFWRHAAAAEEIIARFREPKTKYHNSLIVTLFYAMNDEFLDEVDDELTAYDEKIKALRKATTAQRAA
jgi:ppGpp synthetase/RelA/SpoT-type nucleotidyltranferase